MTARATDATNAAPAGLPLGLPPRIKVLYVAPRDGAGHWLSQAFAADGASQIVLEEVIGAAAGMARLRDEVFDAVLVSHDPPALDGVEFAAGFRAGGGDEPLLILGNEPPQRVDAVCYEAGADDYCCVGETTVRALLWRFARAIQRFNLSRENRRLVQAERQRLRQEHQEAERLLEQQRALIDDLRSLQDGDVADRGDETLPLRPPTGDQQRETPCHDLPVELVGHYREMLRAYVIMGAGNLAREMAALADLLAGSGVSAQRTMQLHVEALEELVAGLGNRSARHVMNRADLLALEVMGHLADGYRQRYHERRHPPRQLILPGFDPGSVPAPLAFQAAA